MIRSWFTSVWIFLFLGAGLLHAQEEILPVAEKEHEWLWQLEGEWIFEGELPFGFEEKDRSPAKVTIHSKRLGNFWIVSESTVDFSTIRLKSMSTLGYDPLKRKYTAFSVSTLVNTVIQLEGTLDAGGKILTLESDGPKEATPGRIHKSRSTYEFKSKDHYVVTSEFQNADGKWIERKK